MKHYITTLFAALLNSNPYQEEVSRLKEDIEASRDIIQTLRSCYHDELKKATEAERMHDECMKIIKDYGQQLVSCQKQLASCQSLVEVLRERNEELKDSCQQAELRASQVEKDYHEAWENLRKSNIETEYLRNELDRKTESYENCAKGYACTIALLQTKIDELNNKETSDDE